jgi:hypothetical protein
MASGRLYRHADLLFLRNRDAGHGAILLVVRSAREYR